MGEGSAPGRLVPEPDEATAPYWAAAAEHVLTVARCAHCDGRTLPPRVTCPACGSTQPAWTFVPVAGTGVVRSWTVVRQSFVPGFDDDLPFVLVDVELDGADGIRIIGRLLDGVDAALRIHAPVTVAFEDLAAGVAIPAFSLA